ncbi:hypothetical protein GO986_15925 [Deinococcus sp. HMF7620]|uniref:N-acetyltransferase domain-containing protein n=1 Tax=Deinococcus arboris TaxID=2682977 RepID=A0A7C9LQ24_9DEIO|nr:GNAT family N-acetyltransferase [Deinococcus arboris]MVN88236.1 hypothetical protein [Deinococcus arboris]
MVTSKTTYPPQLQIAFENAETQMVRDLFSSISERERDLLGMATLDVAGATLQLITHFPTLTWFNRTLGLGLSRPVTDDDLSDIQAAVRRSGASQIMVSLHPQAQPADLEARLLRLGALPTRALMQLGRDVASSPIPIPAGIEVREVGLDALDTFMEVFERGYGLSGDWRPMFQGILGRLPWHSYLAFQGDEAVGCASLAVFGDFGWLGNAAVVPQHRRQGVQAALIARRIQDSARLGAKYLLTQVAEDLPESPNPSEHNMRRAGFVTAYRRPNYLLPCD